MAESKMEVMGILATVQMRCRSAFQMMFKVSCTPQSVLSRITATLQANADACTPMLAKGNGKLLHTRPLNRERAEGEHKKPDVKSDSLCIAVSYRFDHKSLRFTFPNHILEC